MTMKSSSKLSRKDSMKSKGEHDHGLEHTEIDFTENCAEEQSKIPEENSSNLRNMFVENYSVQIEIPAYYYFDAKYVPNNVNYVVALNFHIIPTKQVESIQTTFLDGRFEESTFKDIYDSQMNKNLMLTLNRVNGRAGLLQEKKIIMTGLQNVIIEFSKSGKHFAIFTKGENILSVYDSSDIFKCFEQIERNQPLFRKSINQIKGANRMVFDVMDRMILISSLEQIIIFSLDHQKYGEIIQNYTIDHLKYTAILDVVVNTEELCQNSIDKIAN